jgi:hypothetical protein
MERKAIEGKHIKDNNNTPMLVSTLSFELAISALFLLLMSFLILNLQDIDLSLLQNTQLKFLFAANHCFV